MSSDEVLNTEFLGAVDELEAVLSTEEISTEVGEAYPDASELLRSIDDKLGVIVLLLLFSFCWTCMRHWRNNVLKGV